MYINPTTIRSIFCLINGQKGKLQYYFNNVNNFYDKINNILSQKLNQVVQITVSCHDETCKTPSQAKLKKFNLIFFTIFKENYSRVQDYTLKE